MYTVNVPIVLIYQIFLKVFETSILLDGLVIADINVKKKSI